jgi:hypothetical protein
MEYCGDGKYKWCVTIKEAFVKLEKYVDASDHNTVCPIISTWVASLKLQGGSTGSDS